MVTPAYFSMRNGICFAQTVQFTFTKMKTLFDIGAIVAFPKNVAFPF
jgi:hypothetical protein